MSKYNIPENNSLKEEIEELLTLCEEDEDEYGEGATYFEIGISENEMVEWEKRNGIEIPESYKEWLRFSAKCQIRENLAEFYSVDKFNSIGVPEELIKIGNLIGDGEVLCFSKKTGKFVWYDHGDELEYDSFKDIIDTIMDIM